MHETVPVLPGPNLLKLLGDQRLTKRWVREIMKDHPEWDWRIVSGPYINGEGAIRYKKALDVKRRNPDLTIDHVCFIEFQESVDSPFGYQAVVR